MDFVQISVRSKKGFSEIYPKFVITKSNDLMIRGSDFYAIWDKDKGLWSTEETDAIQLIDKELSEFNEEYKKRTDTPTKVLYLWDSDTGTIDKWHKFCQKQMPDNYHMLDEKIMFANSKVGKRDYASKILPYPLEDAPIDAYDQLMSVLYSDEERHKIEWAIGSIVTGDSKKIEKFLVLYGAAGTGKSTVLNIILALFDGYCSVFDAKALGSSSNSFALEAFKSNPLVAVQQDGDLSRIEDNTRLNSLVSHELMTVNEKFKSTYASRFKCFLFMGTNKPVKITDAKSGLIRRLIDVSPTGNKIPYREFLRLKEQIKFELGGIAYHCREVYLSDPDAYNNYIPKIMLGASNDFYNFMSEYYFTFKNSEFISKKQAWEMYKTYCDDAKVSYPYPLRAFAEELKNYFDEYEDRYTAADGTRVRSVYLGFKESKFEQEEPEKEPDPGWLKFNRSKSILDKELAGFKAQYATDFGTPQQKWADVETCLADIDTSKLHYVKVPLNHIVIDFDIKDQNGEKSFSRNLEEANKWPPTYAELSKSGAGIHLHYIWEGDPTKLASLYAPDIEIKVFKGDASLRRKLTKCNGMNISTLNTGLPLREEKIKMPNADSIKNEKQLRALIKKNLNKEIHPATKPSVDFIYTILEQAYNDGIKYDVTNMKTDIFNFAAGSTNHSKYCKNLVMKMKFKSEDSTDETTFSDSSDLVFYDVEIFPNLFLVNWKYQGEDKKVVRMINPSPADIERLIKYKLVGFNCRRYDNHILYARLMGYTNEQLYNLSQRIVNGDRNAFFGEAYNLSYTDVYDFTSKKQSLKKYEIELGIHHQELGLPWDQPVPEELWAKVAEYCDNDVIATEAVFNNRKEDFTAREILADIAGMTVNDTTNSLTTAIIFGKEKKPQDSFNYRNLAEPVRPTEDILMHYGKDHDYRLFDKNGLPLYKTYNPSVDGTLEPGLSILPFFPGYTYEKGVSLYLGEEIGEGGRVYSEPGIYGNVWDGDVSSMHPHSIISEQLFGKYTDRFAELVKTRVFIKHKDFASAKKMLGGKLEKYLTDESMAKGLAGALKIAINSVYGLTSANFENPFRDIRNVDNIVAKRGALFMTLLKKEVQKRGWKVVHIKTDSIKIPNANADIQKFVIEFGREFGYEFETEEDFDKFCIVNDAVYVAKRKKPVIDKETGKEIWWVATGTQFQVPYVFKTLFTKDELTFSDFCEAKSVSKGDLYLDLNESLPDGEHNYQFVGRTGLFCPILPGHGGGVLYRINDGKPYAAAGTKGYRWLESEVVKNVKKEDDIDISYYENLAKEAVETINKYGKYEDLVSDEPYKPPLFLTNEYGMEAPAFYVDELPF